MANNNNQILTYLRLAAFTVFLGRAWQHLFFSIPLSDFFFDKALFQSLVTSTGTTWEAYTSSELMVSVFSSIQLAGAFICIVGCWSAWQAHKSNKLYAIFLQIGAFWLFILALLSFKSRAYQIIQFTEHAAQVVAPFILYGVVYKSWSNKKLLLWVKVAVAFTFASHGLYALGWPYLRPGNFVDMTMRILHIGEPLTHTFLWAVGFLDIVLSILIFIPGKLAKYAFLYAAVWGLLTAFARVVGYFDPSLPLLSFHQWWFQTCLRLPHAILPLLGVLLLRALEKRRSAIFA